jgi:hypothetical protein
VGGRQKLDSLIMAIAQIELAISEYSDEFNIIDVRFSDMPEVHVYSGLEVIGELLDVGGFTIVERDSEKYPIEVSFIWAGVKFYELREA